MTLGTLVRPSRLHFAAPAPAGSSQKGKPLPWVGEPAPKLEPFKPRFLDATGVLVGQSSGMTNAKSSRSASCRTEPMRPKLGTAKIKVTERGKDPWPDALTKVSRETIVKLRYIARSTMLSGAAVIL
jgi:hypothetical protein